MGTALYVYKRDIDGGVRDANSILDTPAVDAMLSARRKADQLAMKQADARTVGEVERGALRTALMAASLKG